MVKRMREFQALAEESLRLYKRHAGLGLRIALVYFIPYTAVELLFWQNVSLKRKIVFAYGFPIYHGLSAGVILVAGLAFLLFLAALITSIQAEDENRAGGVVSAYRKAAAVFRAYLWVKILYGIRVGLWSLLLLVPGLVAGVLYSLSGMAFLLDGKQGEEALRWSRKMVQGQMHKFLDSVLFFSMMVLALFGAPAIFLHTLIKFVFHPHFLVVLAGVGVIGLLVFAGGIAEMVFVYCLYKNMRVCMLTE